MKLGMQIPVCTVSPLKVVVLFYVHLLLHLHPTHMTDLPMYLSQVPASECSYPRHGEEHAPLLGL